MEVGAILGHDHILPITGYLVVLEGADPVDLAIRIIIAAALSPLIVTLDFHPVRLCLHINIGKTINGGIDIIRGGRALGFRTITSIHMYPAMAAAHKIDHGTQVTPTHKQTPTGVGRTDATIDVIHYQGEEAEAPASGIQAEDEHRPAHCLDYAFTFKTWPLLISTS